MIVDSLPDITDMFQRVHENPEEEYAVLLSKKAVILTELDWKLSKLLVRTPIR